MRKITTMKHNEEQYLKTLCPINLKAYNLFKKHKKDCHVFIECGSHIGQTCEKAVYLGYEKIYSCDIFNERVEQTRERLSKYETPYEIDHLNSENFLKKVLPTVDKKSTLWLDAHGEGGGIPLMEELEIIKAKSKIKNHSILIDDLQVCFSNQIDHIMHEIKNINPDYNFDFGYIHDRSDNSPDILIAST